MAFSVEHIKSLIGSHGGLAKSNLFSVTLPSIKGDNKTAGSDLNLLCKNLQLPPQQLQTSDSTIGGHVNKVVHSNSTDDISMTFHVPNSMTVKEYFEDWQSLAYDKTTRRPGYFDEYAKIIEIKTLSLPKIDTTLETGVEVPEAIRNITGVIGDVDLGPINGNLISGSLSLDFGQNTTLITKLYNAYPYTLGGIEMSNENDAFMEITVSFTFSHYDTKPGLGNLLSGMNPF